MVVEVQKISLAHSNKIAQMGTCDGELHIIKNIICAFFDAWYYEVYNITRFAWQSCFPDDFSTFTASWITIRHIPSSNASYVTEYLIADLMRNCGIFRERKTGRKPDNGYRQQQPENFQGLICPRLDCLLLKTKESTKNTF